MKNGGFMKEKDCIGKIIADARKSKKLTQQELAKILNVSDKAISNWETGKNYPDLLTLKDVAKYLDISIADLIIEEKNEVKKNYMKIIFNIVIFLFFIIFILLIVVGLYWKNNYDKLNVYEIKLNSEEFKLDKSIMIVSNEKIYLDMKRISYKGKYYDCTVSLYYLNGSSKEIIVTKKDYDNFIIDENRGFGLYFNEEMINNLDKLYVNISFVGLDNCLIEKNINLKLDKIISNNKFFNFNNNDEDFSLKRLLILLNNIGYKKSDNNLYVKNIIGDNFSLELSCDINNKIFMYRKEENDFLYEGVYDITKDILNFEVFYNDIMVESFTKDKEKIICLLGKCDNTDKLYDI